MMSTARRKKQQQSYAEKRRAGRQVARDTLKIAKAGTVAVPPATDEALDEDEDEDDDGMSGEVYV